MTKFLVEWTEKHSTQVDAVDENDALSVAAEFTGHNSTIDNVTGYDCKPATMEPEVPPKTASAERAASRERNKGLTPEEMCRRMSTVELDQNIRRGGVAAVTSSPLQVAGLPS